MGAQKNKNMYHKTKSSRIWAGYYKVTRALQRKFYNDDQHTGKGQGMLDNPGKQLCLTWVNLWEAVPSCGLLAESSQLAADPGSQRQEALSEQILGVNSASAKKSYSGQEPLNTSSKGQMSKDKTDYLFILCQYHFQNGKFKHHTVSQVSSLLPW